MTRAIVELEQAWGPILERVRTPENEAAMRLWLPAAKVRPIACEGGVLALECPTSLFQDTIRKRFSRALAEAASAVLQIQVTEVRCQVLGKALREHEERKAAPEPVAPARPQRGWGHGFKLLESFVVGSCNRLAYDAVVQILERPQSAINPLFIHGASGLGKTHLEQGLALAYKERFPKSKVEYVRCEQFTNDFIKACKDGTLEAFRVKMRHPELLLIDDIHFLSQGQMMRTKDELFATFNELSECGKRVVITSDASPREIQYLEERFIQRFSGGLVVEITRPDPQVRHEVIPARARAQEVTLSEEVVDYVADHIIDNVRELEGAVNKLVQFSRSFQRRIDLAAARQALADMLDRGAGESQTAMILREVAARFSLGVEDLTGRNRAGTRATARHVSMYIIKNAGSLTYSAVGEVFGMASHTSVAYACAQVAQYRTKDQALDRFIADLLLRARRG